MVQKKGLVTVQGVLNSLPAMLALQQWSTVSSSTVRVSEYNVHVYLQVHVSPYINFLLSQKMAHVVKMELPDSHTSIHHQESLDFHTLAKQQMLWADWRCALMDTGEVCVMILLELKLLLLHVDNLNMM